MMPVRSYANIALWVALFPLLVMVGNAFIILEAPLILASIQTIPWLTTFLRYVPAYVIITVGIFLLSRLSGRKSITETIKYVGWPYDALDGIIAFFAGTIVGILNVFLIFGFLFLQIILVHGLSVGIPTAYLAVALVGPPEELARCYIQKNLASSIGRCRSDVWCNLLSIVFMTITFGLTHEVSRFVLNFGTGSPVLFSIQDVGWYIGGFVLASLYVIMKSWFANSVAHSWYNLIMSFFLH